MSQAEANSILYLLNECNTYLRLPITKARMYTSPDADIHWVYAWRQDAQDIVLYQTFADFIETLCHDLPLRNTRPAYTAWNRLVKVSDEECSLIPA